MVTHQKDSVAPSAVAKRGFLHRRNGSGHADPKFSADMLKRVRAGRKSKEDEGPVTPLAGSAQDSLAQLLGQQFVKVATSGEDESQDARDEHVPEEDGGPFVVTTAEKELAPGVDASNPRTTTREPFPRT